MIVMDYNPLSETGNNDSIQKKKTEWINGKFDEEWDIHTVSYIYLTKYLLITKGKNNFYNWKVWQTPPPLRDQNEHQLWDKLRSSANW